jgi:hypothetical protein
MVAATSLLNLAATKRCFLLLERLELTKKQKAPVSLPDRGF